MQALTAIGEVGIEVGGRSYLLRPSLFSMSRIGSPTEIVEAFVKVQAPGLEPMHPVFDEWNAKRFKREQFEAAWLVLLCCMGEEDAGPLIGGWVPSTGGTGTRYSAGAMPIQDIIPIARSLLTHGVIGQVPPAPAGAPQGDFLKEFEAADFVASAVAHLGVSEKDAWQMTMTSLIRAMRSKYPPDPKSVQAKPPTGEQIDVTMDRLKKINLLRAEMDKNGR